MLAKAAQPNTHEIAAQRALAALPCGPGLARRTARRSGRVLIRMGAWLMAYGAERARPHTAPVWFSQN
jgi:hypothetical protein